MTQTAHSDELKQVIRSTLDRVGLLDILRPIVRKTFRLIAIARAQTPSQRSKAMRSRGKFQMDEDFLQFAFHDDRAAIAKALAMVLDRPPCRVRLIGSSA